MNPTPILVLALALAWSLPVNAGSLSVQLPQGAYMPDSLADLLPIASGTDDDIFASGFEAPVLVEQVTTYDDLTEGFLGEQVQHDGVSYLEVNEVAGFWPGPENKPFAPGSLKDGGLGNLFLIEDASFLFDDFPEFGSAPNVMTFGQIYVPGPNLSLGALASAWMALDTTAQSVALDLVYYENGPWGGIDIHLAAFLDGEQVAADSLSITSVDPDGRDNLAVSTLTVAADAIDSVHLYAVRISDGAYTAPRVMIDDLRVGRIVYP